MKKNIVRMMTIAALALSTMLLGSAASAKENGAFIMNNGVVGQYKAFVRFHKQDTTLYVTNQKTKKKTVIAKGEVGTRFVIANKNIYYVAGKKLCSANVTGTQGSIIDTECKSDNDCGMKILAYTKNIIYYSKPVNAKFKMQRIYRYNVKTGKKKSFMKRKFSYETSMDIHKNYKYCYDEPTGLGSSYTLSGSKLKENGVKQIATGVYQHIFEGNKLYYVTCEDTTGKVNYVKSDLSGNQKTSLVSFNYNDVARENNLGADSVTFAQTKLTAKNAQFLLLYMKGDTEIEKTFSVDFTSGKIVMAK